MMETEGAFTLEVQIYVNTSTPSRVQTVTLCNVLSFVCRCPTCGKSFNSHLTLKAHMKTHLQTFENMEQVVAEAEKLKAAEENYTCVAAVQSGEQHFIFITQDAEAEQNEENVDVLDKVLQPSKKRIKSQSIPNLDAFIVLYKLFLRGASGCPVAFKSRSPWSKSKCAQFPCFHIIQWIGKCFRGASGYQMVLLFAFRKQEALVQIQACPVPLLPQYSGVW